MNLVHKLPSLPTPYTPHYSSSKKPNITLSLPLHTSSSPFTEKHSIERYQRENTWLHNNPTCNFPSPSDSSAPSTRENDIALQLPELKKLLEVLKKKRENGGEKRKLGNVYLVGTGPGDPELLTVKAMRVIEKADLFLYDRLVSNNVLDLVSSDARLLYVGKTVGYHSRTQVISGRNKVNRSKQVAVHTNGMISFPQLMNEMTEEEGATPYLGEFYVRTHISPKTNDTRDDQSRRNIERMRDIAGVDENGNQLPLTDEIYMKVIPRKRRRRVQLIASGMTSNNFGSQSSTSRLNELENELAEMRRVAHEKEEERIRERDEMRMQFQAQYEDMEAQILQRLINNVPLSSLLNSSLYSNIFVTAPSPENLKTFFDFVQVGLDALKYEIWTMTGKIAEQFWSKFEKMFLLLP